jgi:hypothetical protein
MWSPCSKLLDKRLKLEAYRRHKQALARVKGQVRVTEPVKFRHLGLDLKGQELRREREAEICYFNHNLCKKMIDISSRRRPSQRHRAKSLRLSQMEQEIDRIETDNMRMVSRIENTRSCVSTKVALQQARLSETYRRNISQNARRSSKEEDCTLRSTVG